MAFYVWKAIVMATVTRQLFVVEGVAGASTNVEIPLTSSSVEVCISEDGTCTTNKPEGGVKENMTNTSSTATTIDKSGAKKGTKPQRYRRHRVAPSSPATTTTSQNNTQSSSSGGRIPRNEEAAQERRTFPDQCQLYMAQSSIPNAGIGIFTSVDFEEGESIGEPELLIPLTDIMFQNHWLIDDVQWDTTLDPRLFFESHSPNSIYYPGFGAQINCHFGLNNVEHTTPEYDAAGYHRAQDPGAGGFTNWYGMANKAVRHIEAGEELFVNYGNNWFIERHHIMGDIPFEENFEEADDLISKLHDASVRASKDTTHDTHDWTDEDGLVLEDVLDLIRDNVPSRTKSAMPSKWADVASAAEHGTARHSLGGRASLKTTEWLETNGACVDHIYVDTSSIPQAGRGAFAKRFLRKGDVVAPAPVLQVLRNQTLVYEPLTSDPGDYDPSQPTGIQLMRNYAWGHPDSSMLFLPYAPNINFINHGSTDKGEANVELRWSSNPINRRDWFDVDPAKVVLSGFGLLMEYVALRDIEPHEEILVDYGPAWEAAWKEHVEDWTPLKGSDSYVAVEDIDTSVLKTVAEQKVDAYPRNVDTACYFSHTEDTKYETIEGKSKHYTAEWSLENFDCIRYCQILRRHTDSISGKTHYGVKLQPSTTSSMSDYCWIDPSETIFVRHVPAYAVKLVDRVFSRDQHLPNAFRHEMGLPFDMLPGRWRDLAHLKGEMEPLDAIARGLGPSFTKKKAINNKETTEETEAPVSPPKKRELKNDGQCRLYLAPSTIPNAGVGIFTAVDIEEGEDLGEAEIVVPLVNYSHEGQTWMLPDEVLWSKDAVEELLLFESGGDVDSFIPGFGAAINCHMGLNNVEHSYANMDRAGLSVARDAGASARTLWGHVTNQATRDIVAGEELFIDYGEHWFTARNMDFLPFEGDYEIADALLANLTRTSIFDIADKSDDSSAAFAAAQDVLDMIRGLQTERVAFALPRRVEELQAANDVGTARYGMTDHDSWRTQEWLNEHGSCIDHLYASQSTVKQAGMGAFSKHALRRGEVVSPMPLLHLSRSHLEYENSSKGMQTQVLLNYCFGHPNSEVLLLPYSPIVNYINHGSTASGNEPNVELRWSNKKGLTNKFEWFDLPADKLLKQGFGLHMELVALKDIQPGDEIFMDYGLEWEEAWKEHEMYWSPSKSALDAVPAEIMNAEKRIQIRTTAEAKETPYPSNIGTACYYTPFDLTEEDEHEYDPETEEREFYYSWNDEGFDVEQTGNQCLRPCLIREITYDPTHPMNFTVTAEMLTTGNMDDSCKTPDNHYHIISDVPDSAVMFVDKPFRRDTYIDIEQAFRHPIGLPDDLFPTAWLKKN